MDRSSNGQFVKGSKVNVGRKHSKATKEKQRQAQIKNPTRFWSGKKRSEETKLKISKKKKGVKLSKETVKKMCNNRVGMTGKKHTEEAKRKNREAHLGEKSSNWQGGISFEPYNTDWTKTLKRSIRERDKYTCQICSKQQEDRAFHVHHIDYNKLNSNPNNLITLCSNCHMKTNHNRDYWINYFSKLYERIN